MTIIEIIAIIGIAYIVWQVKLKQVYNDLKTGKIGYFKKIRGKEI